MARALTPASATSPERSAESASLADGLPFDRSPDRHDRGQPSSVPIPVSAGAIGAVAGSGRPPMAALAAALLAAAFRYEPDRTEGVGFLLARPGATHTSVIRPDLATDLSTLAATVAPLREEAGSEPTAGASLGWLEGVSDDQAGGCALWVSGSAESPQLGFAGGWFDEPTAARVAAHLATLVEGGAGGPERSIGELPLLPVEERRKLTEVHPDPSDIEPASTLHGRFASMVQQHPEREALRYGSRGMTYLELSAAANRTSRALISRGVRPGDRVVLLLETRPAVVATMLGVLQAGATMVCIDPDYPAGRISAMLPTVEPRLIVTDARSAAAHQGVLGRLETPTLMIGAGEPPPGWEHVSPAELEALSDEPVSVAVDPTAPCYVAYTSGSTGTPKGIVQTHAAFSQFLSWQSRTIGIDSETRWAQWASIAYDASYCEIFGTLCFGGTLLLADAATRYNPAGVVDWLRSEGATVFQVVPSFAREVVEVVERRDATFPSLRSLMVAGERFPVDLARRWIELPGATPEIWNLYGPSESVLATHHRVDPSDLERPALPIGRPVDGRQILVLDAAGRLAPIGVRGEIHIRSPFLTDGYHSDPDETARRYIQNPLHDDFDDPVFRTGDVGRWRPDGLLEFFGRNDNLVKLRGVRVELGDVEAALRSFDGVRDAAAVVRRAAPRRTSLVAKEWEARSTEEIGVQLLVGYFTADRSLTPAEMRRHLEQVLPTHMVPQHLVQLTELPRNANRKIDLRRLPEIDVSRVERSTPYVEPTTTGQRAIAAVWAEVLGVDEVGADDEFFELGGDSLRAMQVLNALTRDSGVRLSFRDLFTHRTVAELAEAFEADQSGVSQLPVAAQLDSDPKGSHPLSLAQEGIWFLWRLEPDSPFYTAQGSIRLEGPLDEGALRTAWSALFSRHQVLRARFGLEDGRPVQVFRSDMPTDLPLVDLTHLPVDERRDEMARRTATKVRALDLEHDALFEGELFRLGPEEHEIAVTFHEIVLDLWGLSILMRDLHDLYLAHRHARPPGPGDPEAFGRYVRWESATVTREGVEHMGDYWRRQLDGELPVLAVPADHPRPATPSYRGEGESLILGEELSDALRDLSRRQGVTLFSTLLTGLSVLLNAYSGQDEVVIGSPIAHRTHPGADELAGFFLNMLPLRVRHRTDLTFSDLLAEVADTVTDALSNSDYPFSWIAESVRTPRDRNVSPVFQIMFNMLNLPQEALEDDQLRVTFSELDSGYAKYDLSLYAQEHGSRIYLQFVYLTDLFERSTVRRMLDNLEVVLGQAAADPDRPLGRMRVITETERRHLLVETNDTARAYELDRSIESRFEEMVDARSEAVAYWFEGDGLTFGELNTRANRLAHRLVAAGVEPGSPVGIATGRGFDMVTAILGVLKAGGCYVALDTEYPDHRLRLILEDAQPAVLVTSPGHDRFTDLQVMRVALDDPTLGDEPDTNLPPLRGGDRPLAIVYTSATTGRPKGVRTTHRAVMNRLHWMWEDHPFTDDDVAVVQKSYALVAATWELFGGLLRGIPTLLLSLDDVRDPARLWKVCVASRVSYFLAVPALIEGVLLEAERNPGGWATLRLATTSAESIPPQMVERWRAAFPGVPLLNLYGSTECSSNALVYDTSQFDLEGARVPVGRPLPNVRAYILDNRLQPVPRGAVGELCIGGECVALGYTHPPAGTTPFMSDVVRPDDRMVRTGDLARMRHDGAIELVGRSDLQVKVRGFRVELGDVEATLAGHPTVVRCAALLDERDPSRPRLVALVEGPGAERDELRRHLEERLPSYMIPAVIAVVEGLPLTPSGKVHRAALDLSSIEVASDREHVDPRDPLERELVAIWEEVLGVAPIGVTDDFFALGGHSLLAVRMMDQIGRAFRRSLPIALLFQAPTVEAVAERIREMDEEPASANSWETVVPIQAGGDRPPFFCIHDGAGGVFHFNYLARQMGADQPFFGLQPHAWDFGRSQTPSIESLAEHYVREIRTVQEHGPFMIGGFCFGGIVALEVAQQLRADGEEVGVLALIEPSRIAQDSPTSSSDSGVAPPRSRPARLVKRVKSKLVHKHGAELIDEELVGTYRSPIELLKMGRVWIRTRILRLRFRGYLLLGRPIPRQHRNFYFKTEVSRRAGLRYDAQPYDGSIDLFLARRHGLDWERLAGRGTTIHTVPADETGHVPTHLEMLRDPWIEHVAKPLRAAIDAASADGSRG